MGRRLWGLGPLALLAALALVPRADADAPAPLPDHPDRSISVDEFRQYVQLSGSTYANLLSPRDANEMSQALCTARTSADVARAFQWDFPWFLGTAYPSQSAHAEIALLGTSTCPDPPPVEVVDWARAWVILRMNNNAIRLQRIFGKGHADGVCKILDDSEWVTGPVLGEAAAAIGLSGELVETGLSIAVVFCPTVLGWFD